MKAPSRALTSGAAPDLTAPTLEPLPLYHYPPGAACVMCGAPGAEHVAHIGGGCIPACAACVEFADLTPVAGYLSTHPCAAERVVVLTTTKSPHPEPSRS